MTRELISFVFGWRGFLVGRRRSWHAHHRGGVLGHRGGYLLAGPAHQLHRLRHVIGLAAAVFDRGGRAWLFGFGGTPGVTPWGANRPVWRPGSLSNYFFARVRRTHFVRQLGRTWFSPRPRRWRRLFDRPAGGPTGTPAWSTALRRVVDGAGTRGPYAWRFAPGVGRLRTRWIRGWWWRAPGVVSHRFRTATPPGQHVRPGGRVARVGYHAVHPGVSPVKADLPVRTSPAGWATRKVARFQSWPLPFPSVVFAAPTDLLSGPLTGEVIHAGVPLVRWISAEGTPRESHLELLWNPRGTGGVPGWMDHLFGRSHRSGLWRVCWRRLAER